MVIRIVRGASTLPTWRDILAIVVCWWRNVLLAALCYWRDVLLVVLRCRQFALQRLCQSRCDFRSRGRWRSAAVLHEDWRWLTLIVARGWPLPSATGSRRGSISLRGNMISRGDSWWIRFNCAPLQKLVLGRNWPLFANTGRCSVFFRLRALPFVGCRALGIIRLQRPFIGTPVENLMWSDRVLWGNVSALNLRLAHRTLKGVIWSERSVPMVVTIDGGESRCRALMRHLVCDFDRLTLGNKLVWCGQRTGRRWQPM